jgi:hypothetical protein
MGDRQSLSQAFLHTSNLSRKFMQKFVAGVGLS